MHRFREEVLQHVWKRRNIKPGALRTVSGKELKILEPGTLNKDSGPDFFNAQVVVDGLHLAGNIEIHVRTSDWLKHKHQFDSAYNKIILHVVFHHDISLSQNDAYGVEVFELKNSVTENTLSLYEGLLKNQGDIPCARQLSTLDDAVFVSWLEQLALLRLEDKVERINQLFEECRGDYTQTFFLLFMRSVGNKVNALPFELLGKSLPLNLLLRHSDNLLQLESLFLGTAGFFNGQLEDTYLRRLQNEYSFLQRKYGLIPLDSSLFKFSRLRPSNFPTLRLLQVAHLVHRAPEIFRAPQLFEAGSELMTRLRDVKRQPSKRKNTKCAELNLEASEIGVSALQGLMINAFAPFHFFYGEKLNQFQHKTSALQMIKSCRPEMNYKTRQFDGKKHLHTSAFLSQGMIHLYDHYCGVKRCLQCEVGEHLLSA